jgi:hypothetical protein
VLPCAAGLDTEPHRRNHDQPSITCKLFDRHWQQVFMSTTPALVAWKAVMAAIVFPGFPALAPSPILALHLYVASYQKGASVNAPQKRRTFDLIRDALLPEYRDRVDEYLQSYESILCDELVEPALRHASAQQLRGYLLGLNTTRVLGMADWEELDRRVVESWLG